MVSKQKTYQLDITQLEMGERCSNCMEKDFFCGGYTSGNWVFAETNIDACSNDELWHQLRGVGGSDISNTKILPYQKKIDTLLEIHGKSFGVGEYCFVPVNKIISENGKWSRQKDIRARFEISESNKVGLLIVGDNAYLDTLMSNGAYWLAKHIAEYNFDFVTSLGYQIQKNCPVLQARIMIKKNFLLIKDLCSFSIPCIPFFDYSDYSDKQRVLSWIDRNYLPLLAVNIGQRLRGKDADNNFRHKLNRVKELHDHTGGKILVYGCSVKSKIEQLKKVVNMSKIVLVDNKSFLLASMKKNLDNKKRKGSKKELLLANFFRFKGLY